MKKNFFTHLRFLAEVQDTDHLPSLPPLPIIALVGRSNVGKSSLLNAYAQCNIAKASGTPGKTKSLVFFQSSEGIIVDLPGYGYATTSLTLKKHMSTTIDQFFSQKTVSHVLFLLDIRHLPSLLDQHMHAWLITHHIPYTVILTKKDKCSLQEIKKQTKQIAACLGVPEAICYPYSRYHPCEHLIKELYELKKNNICLR